ncbi:hypothetical protein RUM44_003645 [Polyplax serrata]|uniref:Uncharacterized protein n=1 Tax=Polyplax serrata TaxID=468196 RepID=A0ABR1AIP7_POLSC
MKSKKDPDLHNVWNQSTADQGEDEVDDEELNSINNQLDQLDSALDQLEQKNDDIHAQLVQLLESNRQARKQFQLMQNQNNSNENKEAQE